VATNLPSPARLVAGVLASGVWVSLYVLGGFTFEGSSTDKRALFWAAAMVASFAGWGSAVSRLLDREAEVDWGLRAAWGMAAFAVLGGALVSLGIGSGPVLRVMIGVGIGVLCAHALRPNGQPWRPRTDFAYWGAIAIVVPLAFLTCVGSMTDRGQWWAYDDTPAYLVFPRQLVQIGDMLQPFSFRRISSFGAQSLFQATLLVGAAPEHVHLFDRGICGVVVVAMILGAPRDSGSSPFALRLLPAVLVLLLPNYRMNCAAVLSGTLFLFAIYRTLEIAASPSQRPRMHAAVLGLLVAAACALRPFFVLPATATVALTLLLGGKWRSTGRRLLVEEALVIAGTTLAALLPWSLALLRSNGTPLYPPFDGDYRSASGFTTMVLGYERIKMIWDELRYWEPVATIHLFFIAGLVASKNDTPAFRASYFALLVGFIVMLLLIPISDSKDLVRYAYPLELAFVLVVTLRSLAAFAPPGEPSAMAAGVLVLAACAGELYWKHDESQMAYDDMFEQARNLIAGKALLPGGGHSPRYHLDNGELLDTPMISMRAEHIYGELQRAVPAGAPIAAMVEEPYRFDFRRNRVSILDLPGVVGPRGGIPVFHGPEAVAKYFLSLGLRYVALVDTHTCLALYSLRAWEQHGISKVVGPQNFIAPIVLDIFSNFERLGQSRRHLFEEGGMVVLDLGEAP
jgi:hypothetical protein